MAKSFYGAVAQQQQASGTTLTLLRHDVGRPLPHHGHEMAYFILLLRGAYRETTRTRELEYRQCSLVYHPPHFEHRDEIAPGGATFFVMQTERAAPRAFGEIPHLAAEVLGLCRRFRMGIASALDIEETSARLTDASARIPEPGTPPWLRRVVDRLHASPESEWTLDELALEARVHPVHLSRVFRRSLGMKIGDYVQRLRIDRAARMLTGADARIADVAHACGFADHAHFSRVCKAVTGATPTELRDAIV
jgi:AraC family transcriptional regulator